MYTGFRWSIHLERILLPYKMRLFMPTILMVSLSWISFIIPPDSFPGRMGLLVTLVLCIINLMTNEMEQSPATSGISKIDLWCIICLAMVAIASLEYAVLLYLMRFGKRGLVTTCSKTRFSTGTVSVQQAKAGTNSVVTTENNAEEISLFRQQAKVIDYFALISVPALFLIVATTYFLHYSGRG